MAGEKKIIAASIQVDTGNSNDNVKELNKNVNNLKGDLKDVSKETGNTSKSIGEAGGSFSNLKSQISTLPGPLGAAGDGVTKLSGTFKALLANPVVLVLTAIVGVLALLYKAFTNTFAGGEKMQQVFAGIKAAGQALIDNLSRIGSAIKNLFTFQWGKMVDDIKGVAKATGDAYSQMAKLTKEAQKLHKDQLANDLDQAEREKKLAILREQANDDSIPVAKRLALLKQLQADAQKNAADDIAHAKAVTENAIAQLTLQKDGAQKNQDAINKLKIDQIKVETDNANELRRIGKQITTAEKIQADERNQILKDEEDRKKESAKKAKEHAAEQKKLVDEQIKNEKALAKAKQERLIKEIADIEAYGKQLAKEQADRDKAEEKRLFDNEQTMLKNKQKLAELDALNNPDSIDAKIEKIQADLELENSVLAENDLQRQINEKNASDAIVKIKQDQATAEMQIEEAKAEHQKLMLSRYSTALNQLSDLVGKKTALGKTLAVAAATIDTYQSAVAAYKSLAGIPYVGPVLGGIAAAAAIATGIASVKKILSVQVPGGGGGGSAPSGVTIPGAPVAPRAQTTQLDQGSLSQIGNATARAYVLDSDAVNHRERNERLNRAARLGG